MDAVIFDLDETLLDRTASLKDFCHWQATTQLRDEIEDPNQFNLILQQICLNVCIHATFN